jgi:hypothetical protein
MLGLGLDAVRLGRALPGGTDTAPVFVARPIPAQTAVLGQSWSLDLRPHVIYSGGLLALSAAPPLPAGLDFDGLSIAGTPSLAGGPVDHVLTATALTGALAGQTRQTVLSMGIEAGNTAPLGADVTLFFDVAAGNSAPMGADTALFYEVAAGL